MKTASEVKAFLKTNGFTDKVKVRLSHNPFGGEDKFQIALANMPDNVRIATRSDSTGTRFFSDTKEGVEYVAKLHEINRICKENNVNAFAVDRII